MATSLPMTAVRQICGASYCLNPRELLESLSKTVPVIPRKEVPCTQNFTEHQHAQAMSSIHSLPCSFPKMIMYACVLSHFNRVQLFAIPWIAPCQAPLCMGFSRQEYWSGLPCPPLGDLPDPGIKPESLMFLALAGTFFTTRATWEVQNDPFTTFEGFYYWSLRQTRKHKTNEPILFFFFPKNREVTKL